jgi:hypothetical protein
MKRHPVLEACIRILWEWGATDVEPTLAGSGNIRIDYKWKGNSGMYFIAATPSEARSIHNCIAGLKRQLGKPLIVRKRPHKTMADLMADLEASARRKQTSRKEPDMPQVETNIFPTYSEGTLQRAQPDAKALILEHDKPKYPLEGGMGAVACYALGDGKKRLTIVLPKTVETLFPGLTVDVERVNRTTWSIKPGKRLTMRLRPRCDDYSVELSFTPTALDAGLSVWGLTPSFYTIATELGDIHITVDLAKLKPVIPRSRKQPELAQPSIHPPRPIWKLLTEDDGEPAVQVSDLPVTPPKGDIKTALDTIARVERTTPMRLERRADGTLTFVLVLD